MYTCRFIHLKHSIYLCAMYKDKKVVVVLPAYNASRTLAKTYAEIPRDIVDEVILCDDASRDNTVEEAHALGIHHIIRHEQNKGYGGNQKSLYKKPWRSMPIS